VDICLYIYTGLFTILGRCRHLRGAHSTVSPTERTAMVSERIYRHYTMRHGTGLDLFRAKTIGHGRVYLSEVRYIKEGKWPRFRMVLNEDKRAFTVSTTSGRIYNTESRKLEQRRALAARISQILG